MMGHSKFEILIDARLSKSLNRLNFPILPYYFVLMVKGWKKNEKDLDLQLLVFEPHNTLTICVRKKIPFSNIACIKN